MEKGVHISRPQNPGRLLHGEVKIGKAGSHHPHDIRDGQYGVADQEAGHGRKLKPVYHIPEHYKAQNNDRDEYWRQKQALDQFLPLKTVAV